MAAASRRYWLIFSIGFGCALTGAFVLLNPTLEFLAVDLLERFHLPIGLLGNLALYTDAGLLLFSGGGLLILGLRALVRCRRA